MTQPSATDPDISGWYLKDNESQPQRVRVAIENRSLSLCTLTGSEIARWSLDQLENVSIPVLGRDWVIRDRRVEEPVLLLENEQEYAAIQCQASDLAPVSARTVQQAKFAAGHAGSITGWPVILLIVLAHRDSEEPATKAGAQGYGCGNRQRSRIAAPLYEIKLCICLIFGHLIPKSNAN